MKRKKYNIKRLHKVKKDYILCIRYEPGLDIYRLAIDTKGYHVIYLDLRILPHRLNEAALFIYDKLHNHPDKYTVEDLENDLIKYLGDNAMYITEDFGFRIEHDKDAKFYKLYIDTDTTKDVLLNIKIPEKVIDNVLRKLAEVRSDLIRSKSLNTNDSTNKITIEMLDLMIMRYIIDLSVSAEYLNVREE